MGFRIEDGGGTNGEVKVTVEQKLEVDSISEPKDHHLNQVFAKAWMLNFEAINPTAADDYVFYLKNTGSNNIEIVSIRLSVDTAASQIELHAVTGTASSGSTITPVPLTVGSSVVPTALIESSVDFTGLTSVGIITFVQCPVVATDYFSEIDAHIIIPNGAAVALLVETGTANLTGSIEIVED